ncbi:uncharacterized protein LOC109717970 [Ananas comosus]|uniref:Uncharacterized protein LOC109717970 n=1 Tax=Ananas comosus TaxID=4615 RepID=A0A6P5G2N0_ANACO|nr:uncharacterized protein LOC109717970 [Ananas comosus]
MLTASGWPRSGGGDGGPSRARTQLGTVSGSPSDGMARTGRGRQRRSQMPVGGDQGGGGQQQRQPHGSTRCRLEGYGSVCRPGRRAMGSGGGAARRAAATRKVVTQEYAAGADPQVAAARRRGRAENLQPELGAGAAAAGRSAGGGARGRADLRGGPPRLRGRAAERVHAGGYAGRPRLRLGQARAWEGCRISSGMDASAFASGALAAAIPRRGRPRARGRCRQGALRTNILGRELPTQK